MRTWFILPAVSSRNFGDLSLNERITTEVPDSFLAVPGTP
jgi:hypothetical protein